MAGSRITNLDAGPVRNQGEMPIMNYMNSRLTTSKLRLVAASRAAGQPSSTPSVRRFKLARVQVEGRGEPLRGVPAIKHD